MNLDINLSFKYDYIIYTDGACIGNPGPGGWAAILFHKKSKDILRGAEKQTTNNRMELIASIQALKFIKTKAKINLFTDSKYLIDGINIWIKDWKSNNWKKNDNKDVKNVDLWKELDELVNFHYVEWNWVKGHSGNKNNEEVDRIARNEAENI
ncbi:MAG: ribonuclease HI [Alphaproteobacteria bacterium]|jgi:ribonuclease HI|nr:ribonuclease HI [Alphaproteobacteria bacterium]